jgi:hypothetical protein
MNNLLRASCCIAASLFMIALALGTVGQGLAAEAKKQDSKKEQGKEAPKPPPTPIPAGSKEQTITGKLIEIGDGKGGKYLALDVNIAGLYVLDITHLNDEQVAEVKKKVGGALEAKGVLVKRGSDAPLFIVTQLWGDKGKMDGKPITESGKLCKVTDENGLDIYGLDKARNGFWHLDLSKLDENKKNDLIARVGQSVTVTGVLQIRKESDTPVILVESAR